MTVFRTADPWPLHLELRGSGLASRGKEATWSAEPARPPPSCLRLRWAPGSCSSGLSGARCRCGSPSPPPLPAPSPSLPPLLLPAPRAPLLLPRPLILDSLLFLSPVPSFFFCPPPTALPSPLRSGECCCAARLPKSLTSMLAWWLACGQQ